MSNPWDKDSIEHGDQAKLETLFVGRAITEVDAEENTLKLDDGRVLTIHGNEGCGGCGEGWYGISHLEKFPNIITAVDVTTEDDGYGNVRLFVYSEGIKAEVVTAEGSDNGYYGTGFWIEINTNEGTE